MNMRFQRDFGPTAVKTVSPGLRTGYRIVTAWCRSGPAYRTCGKVRETCEERRNWLPTAQSAIRRPRRSRSTAGSAPRGANSPSSSSSATTRRGSTTTSASSGTGCSRAGRCQGRAARAGHAAPRRSRRGPPARVRHLRGRDPARASTAPERSRSGTAAPTSCVEEKKDGGLTVRLHGERLDGLWGARSRAAVRPGEELADPAQARGRRGRAARAVAPLHADAGDPRRAAAAGRGLAVRAEVGRLPRARLRARRRGRAAQPATATT